MGKSLGKKLFLFSMTPLCPILRNVITFNSVEDTSVIIFVILKINPLKRVLKPARTL